MDLLLLGPSVIPFYAALFPIRNLTSRIYTTSRKFLQIIFFVYARAFTETNKQ